MDYSAAMDLTTCLWFDGRAREAANFYTSIFPGSEIADHWIAPTETPGNEQGSEVLVHFTIFDRPFIALNGGPDAEGRQRATQAMLAMKKIDLGAMKKAYEGK
jgi:predicted 3-demethylubiquinone-9 3-methyltransferase (glyoxalase superfamily)